MSRKEAVIDVVDVTIQHLRGAVRPQQTRARSKNLQHARSASSRSISKWENMIHNPHHPKGKVVVGIVGKYLQHQDAYKSVFEALYHGALANQVTIEIRKFESDKSPRRRRGGKGDWGMRWVFGAWRFWRAGLDGKNHDSQILQRKKIPYFGLCLGMQVMCVEFARHVLGLTDANSTEIDPHTTHPVISLLSEQRGIENLGGPCALAPIPANSNREQKPTKLMARRGSQKDTATAMNSTTFTKSNVKRKD